MSDAAKKMLVCDILRGQIPDIRCVRPGELMVLEHREEQITHAGIVLLPTAGQKYNQLDLLPEWLVIAVGTDVEKQIGVVPNDRVVVRRNAGRPRSLDEIPVRLVDFRDVLAVVRHEVSDFMGMIRSAQEEKKPDGEGWVTV